MRRADTSPEELSFLSQLGLRLRRARAVAGIARRQLAERSGVSERYLAQLESGDGNVSILLIRRLADALAVDLLDLIGPPVETGRRGRIALLGASGPTRRALAQGLAGRLGIPLFDLCVEAAGAALSEAEPARPSAVLEADAARRALAGVVDAHARCVVDVPDAFVVEANVYRLLRARCLTVWLGTGARDPVQTLIGPGEPQLSPEREAAVADLRALIALRDRLQARADLTSVASEGDVAGWIEALMPMLAEAGADLREADDPF